MRFLKIAFWIVIIFVVVWVAASIVDIMLHNLDEHPTYQWWNLIDMYFKNSVLSPISDKTFKK